MDNIDISTILTKICFHAEKRKIKFNSPDLIEVLNHNKSELKCNEQN